MPSAQPQRPQTPLTICVCLWAGFVVLLLSVTASKEGPFRLSSRPHRELDVESASPRGSPKSVTDGAGQWKSSFPVSGLDSSEVEATLAWITLYSPPLTVLSPLLPRSSWENFLNTLPWIPISEAASREPALRHWPRQRMAVVVWVRLQRQP